MVAIGVVSGMLAAAGLAAEASTNVFLNEGVPVLYKGATPGQWTMDMDAAKALASDKGLPILYAFTGSDWCRYCKVVFRDVFAKPEWQAFASNRFVMVNIDVPNAPLLPIGILNRNKAFAKSLNVGAFPTFVVSDATGTNFLSQFSLSEKTTPFYLMKESATAMRATPSDLKQVLTGIPDEKAAAYRESLEKFGGISKDFEAWLKTSPKSTEENERKFTDFRQKLADLSETITAIEVEKFLGAMAQSETAGKSALLRRADAYSKLLTELDSARRDLTNWLLSRPEENDKSRETFRLLTQRIEELEAKIRGVK